MARMTKNELLNSIIERAWELRKHGDSCACNICRTYPDMIKRYAELVEEKKFARL